MSTPIQDLPNNPGIQAGDEVIVNDVSNSNASTKATFAAITTYLQNNLTFSAGPQGDAGPRGLRGLTGADGSDGSDATVDTTNLLTTNTGQTITAIKTFSASTNFANPAGVAFAIRSLTSAGANSNISYLVETATTRIFPSAVSAPGFAPGHSETTAPDAADTLDYYEEGSFTPTFPFSFVRQGGSGTFTRIGDRVFCRINFTGRVTTANLATLTVAGLPFAPINAVGNILGSFYMNNSTGNSNFPTYEASGSVIDNTTRVGLVITTGAFNTSSNRTFNANFSYTTNE